MLNSLQTSVPQSPINADVAIVGSGLAGLVLASALADQGLSVVVLESGGVRQNEEIHPLNEVELTAECYQGAAAGRVRALGGTSTRWGGALLPYVANDFERHTMGWHDGWGLGSEELSPYLASIEKKFGVVEGSYESEANIAGLLPSFSSRLPKWPLFQRRATSKIFREEIRGDSRLQVWIEATVTEIRLDACRVGAVIAQNANGNRLEVCTAKLAITAGAIETTRLLLLLNRANDSRVFPLDSPLGYGFHDHLSAPIANLERINRVSLTRLFSFRFVPGGMRNLRFELTRQARVDSEWPAAFLHVSFNRNGENGFEGLRRIYQAVQRGARPEIGDFVRVVADFPWLFRAGWWRFAERRVFPPTGAGFDIHLVTEQKPDNKNRISLSNTAHDCFGQALAQIEWRVSEEDKLLFSQISERAIAEWRAGPLSAFAELRPRNTIATANELAIGGGIYHPAGSTRIGPDASRGVVDSRLRVHGVPGLWAIATSVFPSIGGTSPSLGLMQFALRAADDIAAETR